MCQQHPGFRALRLDKHFREGRVRLVRRVLRHRELDIAGEFQLAAAQRPVRDSDAPQLRIVFDRHREIERGFNSGNAPPDLRTVRRETNDDLARYISERFMGGGPDLLRLQIANVEEAAPRIEGRVGSPPRHVEAVPFAVPPARVRDHQGVAPVAVQVYPRGGGFLGPDAVDRLFFTGRADRHASRLGFDDRKAADWNSFEEKGLDRTHPQIAMEAALHGVPMQKVIKRHEAHTLVVSHVAVNDHTARPPSVLSREKSIDS